MTLCKDAITGETFGDIRVGTYGEWRLFTVRGDSSEDKLFFGPLDDVLTQKERFWQWKSRSKKTGDKKCKKKCLL